MIDTLVLLAGGLATRLRPISETIPKSLIDIEGKPFILYQLELLKAQGIKKVVVCTGYLGNQIEEVLNKENFGLEILFSYDGEKLLGTAGAIKKAENILPEEFFVMYGDSYLPINFSEVSDTFKKSGLPALMTVFKNEGKWDTSNVIYKNDTIKKYSKKERLPEMNFIDYGLGILNKKCLNEIKQGEESDLALIYENLANKEELAAFEVKNRFYEIGSFSGIEEFKDYIKNQHGKQL